MSNSSEKLSAAIAAHQAGEISQAATIYQEILNLKPNHADATHLLGLTEFQQGRHEAAAALIETAIGLNGVVALYHANLGRACMAAGRAKAAAVAYLNALALDRDNAEIHSDLAAAHVDVGDFKAAAESGKRAVELDPSMAQAHFNLGLAEAGCGSTESAIGCFEKTIRLAPNFYDCHFELAKICQETGYLEAAIDHYRSAIAVNPGMVEAHCNQGNVLRELFRLDEAAASYRRALGIDPGIGEIHANLGVTLQEMGLLDAAMEAYDHAVEITPDDPEARRNRAMALLQLGHFKAGWRDFEWRWRTRHFLAIRRDWLKPQWRGEPSSGATILVHSEQGFGDCIQFARYLPMVAASGGRVVVECPSVLAGLIGNLAEVVCIGAPLPAHDFQVPMMSLPGIFKTDFQTMPSGVPYLAPPATTIERWRKKIEFVGGLKVGVAWSGSFYHQRNAWRSPGLKALLPLLALQGIRFYSLQVDNGRDDLVAEGIDEKVVDLSPELSDFSETAAAMINLDLIIAPDTAVAHLAGALARPVWLMLPFASEWRWFTERADSPWYPTMKLFRQSSHGDWSGPVGNMIEAIGRSK